MDEGAAARGWRIFLRVLAIFFISLGLAAEHAESAVLTDGEMAQILAEKLGAKFAPEYLRVKVLDSHAYAEARGVSLSGVMVDSLRIEAILISNEAPEDDDVKALASLIGYSWGEVVLRAEDINKYFAKYETRGFSDLVVNFSPSGFRVEGIFTTSLLFTLRVRLSATGNFALKPDGVYIDDAAMYIENHRQPEFIKAQALKRANPLITWSEIPFKIVFKDIGMTDSSAIMTGNPRDFDGGETAVWEGGRVAQ
ncbi:MAG: hypothetical protein LBB28_02410 [Synergistaceae bacterium]|jgi:hypothetical protein|nr:hypothetical protein [Synergistaceae bacterium]